MERTWNAKLGNLSKRSRVGSENSTASKGQNQLYISGKPNNLITQVRRRHLEELLAGHPAQVKH